MNNKFIISNDKHTIESLKKAGLQCLSNNGTTAIFFNDGTFVFERKGLKLAYTDTIMF